MDPAFFFLGALYLVFFLVLGGIAFAARATEARAVTARATEPRAATARATEAREAAATDTEAIGRKPVAAA